MPRCSVVLALLCLFCDTEVEQARKDLASPDPEVRATAARVLGNARDRQSAPRLVELLADKYPDVRKEAARALGKIAYQAAAPPLADLYATEEHADVMDAAVRALVRIGPGAVEPLLGLLSSVRAEVRAGACRALGKLETKRAVDPLVRLLRDRDSDVRIAAVYALRRIGDKRGLSAVADAIADEDRDVSAAAEKALSGRGYEDQFNKAKRLLRGLPR